MQKNNKYAGILEDSGGQFVAFSLYGAE